MVYGKKLSMEIMVVTALMGNDRKITSENNLVKYLIDEYDELLLWYGSPTKGV